MAIPPKDKSLGILAIRIMKKYLILLMLILIPSIYAAYYVTNPVNCPSSDAVNFPGQDCSPQDICGISGGACQCFTTSSIVAPSSNTTTSGGGTNYACSDATCNGGYIVDCYAAADASAPFCDNSAAFWCDMNTTCNNAPNNRETICKNNTFANSNCGACKSTFYNCSASTNCQFQAGAACNAGGTYVLNQCYSSTAGNCTSASNSDCNNDDSDGNPRTCNGANGCEITAGGACGAGTGTYAAAQCVGTGGNCTSATRLDCDNDDSDSNLATCNGVNGCEILNGGACTIGSMVGTYSGCTCVVSKSFFQTGTFVEYQTNSTQGGMLWFKDYYTSAILLNISNYNNETFTINKSGCVKWMDNSVQCTASTGSGGGLIASTPQLYNDSTKIYLNDTYVNITWTTRLLHAADNSSLWVSKLNVSDQRFNDTSAFLGNDSLKFNVTGGSVTGNVNMSGYTLTTTKMNFTNSTGALKVQMFFNDSSGYFEIVV